MKRLVRLLDPLRADDGVTSMEYALIAMLVAVFCIAAVKTTGEGVQRMYDSILAATSIAFGG